MVSHVDTRLKAAEELRIFVEGEVRDLSSDLAVRFLDELTNRVFDLVNSADVNEKLGGIAVIDELIEVKSEVNETMIIRVSHKKKDSHLRDGVSSLHLRSTNQLIN